MYRIKGFFIRVLSFIYAAAMLIGSPGRVAGGEALPRADNVLTSVNVISDIHMEGNNFYRKNVYVQGMRNMREYTPGLDALIMCGDNTMNGQPGEYFILNGLTSLLLPDADVLPVCGNHDLGGSDDDLTKMRDRFIDQYNALQKEAPIDRLWYSIEMDGCMFISLSEDIDEAGDALVFTDDELRWFNARLDAAGEAGVPTLVGCHYPLYYMDDAVRDAITAHRNVYYFCGHMHRPGVAVHQIDGRDDLWNIDLPVFTECKEENGETTWYTGYGVNVQITAVEITLNTYSFYAAELIESITLPIIRIASGG